MRHVWWISYIFIGLQEDKSDWATFASLSKMLRNSAIVNQSFDGDRDFQTTTMASFYPQ